MLLSWTFFKTISVECSSVHLEASLVISASAPFLSVATSFFVSICNVLITSRGFSYLFFARRITLSPSITHSTLSPGSIPKNFLICSGIVVWFLLVSFVKYIWITVRTYRKTTISTLWYYYPFNMLPLNYTQT